VNKNAMNIELPEERRQRMLERLHTEGKLVATELSDDYGVSEDTIRRDLREMAAAGLLMRVHGGALPMMPYTQPYAEREDQDAALKVSIARTASRLVMDGNVIFLGSGTTNLEIAKHFHPALHATVITISPQIAVTLMHHQSINVIQIGGQIHKTVRAAVDAQAIDEIKRYFADICFLGICSLHPQVGYSVSVHEEAAINRAIIAQSADVVATVTANKLGTIAPYIVVPLTEITHIVTEAHVPDDILAPYQDMGIETIRASDATD
jgi:DeoR/GlpR family transcriptional regulator of sugar metabolism